MNSVDKHLTAASKAATLLTMRSAKKEVLFVVEGDTDVDLLSDILGLSRSNILSCNGKEVLMAVYSLSPQKGIDAGTIFLRDRDHDSYVTSISNGVLLIVTQRYDIEMDLLAVRVFGRIVSSFNGISRHSVTATDIWALICYAGAKIGALREYSKVNSVDLQFDDLKYSRFLEIREFDVDLEKMIRYFYAKSSKTVGDIKQVVQAISSSLNTRSHEEMVCAKECFDLLEIYLSRSLRVCHVHECGAATLERMFRVAATNQDFKSLNFYSAIVTHISQSGFAWTGHAL